MEREDKETPSKKRFYESKYSQKESPLKKREIDTVEKKCCESEDEEKIDLTKIKEIDKINENDPLRVSEYAQENYSNNLMTEVI